MTEVEWLTGVSAGGYLNTVFRLVRSPHDRKQRLAVLGMLRVMAARSPEPSVERLLTVHEDWLDHWDFDRFNRELAGEHSLGHSLRIRDGVLRRKIMAGLRGVHHGGECRLSRIPFGPEDAGVPRAVARDVFGNPFRPTGFDPRWRTSDTVGVARAIYEDRAFGRLPLLADALLDAECTDEPILEHCRNDGPHVRGCWVVDLVLGLE